EERLEDAFLFAINEARTAVFGCEDEVAVVARDAERVEAAAVALRVVDEVRERAREERRGGRDGRRATGHDELFGLLASALERAARGLGDVDRPLAQDLEVEARACEQVADERVDLHDLAIELVERVGLDRDGGLAVSGGALSRELGQKADARERRPELVRDR